MFDSRYLQWLAQLHKKISFSAYFITYATLRVLKQVRTIARLNIDYIYK